jgi:hypothetical protein
VPTTVITGRDVTFTIGGNTFDAQATSAVLTGTTNRQAYETLDGKVFKVIDNDFTFAVEMLADWGVAGSLCEILWNATESAPNTGINTVFTAASGAVFSFQILPNFPSAGGTAPDAQTVSLSFQVIGTPAENFA